MVEKDSTENTEKVENMDEKDVLETSTEQDNETVEAEEKIDELSVEDKLKAENQELKDKYLRLYSEFENYRKRTAKERLDLIKTASEDVIMDLIAVLDDFERAMKTEEVEDLESVKEGTLLIYNKFFKILENKGLKSMGELVGEAFDAETQEAITMVPAPSEELKGKVVDVVEKGYTLGDKVIRYAKVVIGS